MEESPAAPQEAVGREWGRELSPPQADGSPAAPWEAELEARGGGSGSEGMVYMAGPEG